MKAHRFGVESADAVLVLARQVAAHLDGDRGVDQSDDRGGEPHEGRGAEMERAGSAHNV